MHQIANSTVKMTFFAHGGISIKLLVVYLHVINECLSYKFHPYSIFTGHTKVESEAYYVLRAYCPNIYTMPGVRSKGKGYTAFSETEAATNAGCPSGVGWSFKKAGVMVPSSDSILTSPMMGVGLGLMYRNTIRYRDCLSIVTFFKTSS